MVFRILVWGLMSFLAWSPGAGATVLGDTVAAMAPGTWRVITPENIGVLDSNTTVYGDKAVWDPISRKLLFMGSYHAATVRFFIYDEADNSWTNAPTPPIPPEWTSQFGIGGHAYGSNTLDAEGNFYFHIDDSVTYPAHCVGGVQCTQRWKYNIATEKWSFVPSITDRTGYGTCCDPTVFFPELNSLLFIDGAFGRIWRYDLASSAWTLWKTNAAYNNNGGGGTWSFAVYNPVLHEVLYGSAVPGQKLFKINAAGTITELGSIPSYVTFYDGSGFSGNFNVDPVTGKFILLPGDRQYSPIQTTWSYDSITDVWSTIANPPPEVTGSLVTASDSTHGVTITLVCGFTSTGSCDGKLAIYKHALGSGVPGNPPLAPSGLTAF
jgi:hypothetical protein